MTYETDLHGRIAMALERIADSLDRLTTAAPALMSVIDINGPTAAAAAIKAATASDARTYRFKCEDDGSLTATDDEGRVEIVKPAPPKTDDNDWISWPGGECPVPDGTLVDVRLRTGKEFFDTDPRPLFWHEFGGGTIVAYRLHKEPTK